MGFGWSKGFTLPGNASMTLYQRLEMCLQHKVHKNNSGEVTPWHYIESTKRPRQQFKIMRDGDHSLIVRLYNTNILWLLNDGTTLLTCPASYMDTNYTRATFGQFGFYIRKEGNAYGVETQQGLMRYYDSMRVSKLALHDRPVMMGPPRPFTKPVANREVNKQVRACLNPVYDVIDMLVLANAGRDLWGVRRPHYDIGIAMHRFIRNAVEAGNWDEVRSFVDKHAVELAELAIHDVYFLWQMTDPKEMRTAIRKSLHEKFKTLKTVEYFSHDDPLVL